MKKDFKQAIMLLEKQIEKNSLEMKIIAFEYIRNPLNKDTVLMKREFEMLEQHNIALEKAIDEMLFHEVKE